MPIKRHQRLPATWRVVLNDYEQREVGVGGTIIPIHRPYGGNINDFRYGRPGREYAVTDGGVVGGALGGDYDSSNPADVARREQEQQLRLEQAKLDERQRHGKRYRKRSELDALAGIAAAGHRGVPAQHRGHAADGHGRVLAVTAAGQGGVRVVGDPSSAASMHAVYQHQFAALSDRVTEVPYHPMHLTPLAARPRPQGDGISVHGDAHHHPQMRRQTEGHGAASSPSLFASEPMSGGGGPMVANANRWAPYPREIPRAQHILH